MRLFGKRHGDESGRWPTPSRAGMVTLREDEVYSVVLRSSSVNELQCCKNMCRAFHGLPCYRRAGRSAD
jgi:hypothetical protein